MKNVFNLIKQNNLIDKSDTVAVACSGGSDSIALLHYLKRAELVFGHKTICVTVDHGIRENSARDVKFVKQFCKENDILCYDFKVDAVKTAKQKGVSLETSARMLRYGIFEAVLNKKIATKIALAHHKQDQAETILMHMFRGSGLNGLNGMQVKKDDLYIRPFLNVSKNSILEYLQENQLKNIEDETNNENIYARNFLRNEVIPQIQKKWPNCVDALINFAKICEQDNSFIMSNLNDDAMIFEDNIVKIPVVYFSYHNAQISRILFKAMRLLGVFVDIEKKHIDLLIEFGKTALNGKKLNLPMGVSAFKEYEYVTLTNIKPDNAEFSCDFALGETLVKNVGSIVAKRVKDIAKNSNALFIDYNKLPRNAVWRFRKDGDMFCKFGGCSKKLKDYFIDKKIPLRDRNCIPVLAQNNNIYAVAGYEISESVKVDKDTKSIIKIEFIK